MSAVSLLAAGAKADSGTGAAVDVTGHAVLKLSAVMTADLSLQPQLRLMIDVASTASGGPDGWKEVYTEGFRALTGGGNTWPASSTRRIVITPDNFIRVRWETRHNGNSTAGLNLSVTGEGLPNV